MTRGPLGGPRPFTESRIKLLIVGHPEQPPTADEIVEILHEHGGLLGLDVENIAEQNIDIDKFEAISRGGASRFQHLIVIEFSSDTAISITRFGEQLKEFQEAVLNEIGAGVFIIAD